MLIEKQQVTTVESTDRPIISLSAFSIQGRRNHMEDFFDVGYQLKPSDQRTRDEWPYEYFYLAVFDGHGGREAAVYAKKHLLKNITKQKDFWSDKDEDVMNAIRVGFEDTQKDMRKKMWTWPRTNGFLPSTAGATASIIFIRNGKFYTGHVGDSRIVISKKHSETKNWIAHPLTDDHKPESPEETARIQRAGGEVKKRTGVHRVVWRRPVIDINLDTQVPIHSPRQLRKHWEQLIPSYPVREPLVQRYQTIPFLAIARSLGDFWSIHPFNGQYIVSPEPDVSCRHIQPEDNCILLATDGLWNVINSSLAIRILQELDMIKSNNKQYLEDEYLVTDNYYDVAGKGENHALSMVYFAYQAWERTCSKSDNITVVVALLHDILSTFHCSNVDSDQMSADSGIVSGFDSQSHIPDTAIVQVGETYNIEEKIRLNQEPRFCYTPDMSKWNCNIVESKLKLPPTIITDKLNLIYPKNYFRLSEAPDRKIELETDESDSYVHIKLVSDDPADERETPVHLNKDNKQVRDASSQATQSIHDFGQPWDQLIPDYDDTWELYDDHMDDGNFDDEDPSYTLMFKGENDFDNIEEEVEESEPDGVEVMEEESPKNHKLIPHLRCLLNYTPPVRRSCTIKKNISQSESSKHKTQHSTSLSQRKSKRRKTQPIRCNPDLN